MQNCELCCTRHPREFWRNEIAYAIDASDEMNPGSSASSPSTMSPK